MAANQQSCLEAALAYAARGWRVLPVRAGSKVPLTRHGVKDATTDEGIIRARWERWPSAGVAIATGSGSGMVVIDVDGPEGEASLAALLKREGHGLPDTRQVNTGRPGGYHLHFTIPSGHALKSTQLGSHLELRGDGLYVLVPPSLHPTGRRYEWANQLDPAPLPEWLIGVVKERATAATPEVEISGEPPQLSNRVKRLLETHEILKLRWAGDPLGLDDITKSGLDASIAAILAPECTDKEIADAIRLVPYNKDRQHQLTPQYLTRTIANARTWLEQQRRIPATATAISPAPQTLTLEEARTTLSDLLFQIVGFLRSYLAISTAQNYVLAIWIFHTHVIEAADRTPYLHVRSPEKRCGKSLVLDLLKLLGRNPWRTSNASPAAIPRKISQSRPTALFDEADTYIRAEDERGETLRGVLDAGFERGGAYSRCVGQGAALKVEDFDVFCPKAIAGLRDLPDTIADRSIPIKMKRALPGEIRQRFYRREAEALASALRARIEACAAALVPTLKDARPERVLELNDRQNDIVESLLAIADLAGDGWPEYLRDFLRELFQSEDESEQNLAVRLLADAREIFTERGIERLASADLVQALRERPEAPWLEFVRGKGLTGHTLARMLRGFGIKPARWWEGKTIRGYEAKDFGDAWARYLPALPCPEGGSTVRTSEPTESTG